jgi:hypothetical protein
VRLWNERYPLDPWIDEDIVPHRWAEMDKRDKTAVVAVHTIARRMGLLALHGSWVDVVDAQGATITVTRFANSGYIDAGVFTETLKAMLSEGGALKNRQCRLIERSVDGSDVDKGMASAGRLVFDAKKKQFRSFNLSFDADLPDLVLQMADESRVQRFTKSDATMVRKLMLDGLESFDVSFLYAVLTYTTAAGHKLLGEDTDFLELRAALTAIKDDRNETTLGHGRIRGVTNAEYKRAIDHIHTFLDACVKEYAPGCTLFDAEWRSHLRDAVVNANNLTSTCEIELVCRSLDDYVKRSHREAKTLYPVQVPPPTHLLVYPSCTVS